jgi:hypothetical protein
MTRRAGELLRDLDPALAPSSASDKTAGGSFAEQVTS